MKDKTELFPITNLRTERKEITLSMNVLDWHRYDILKSFHRNLLFIFLLVFLDRRNGSPQPNVWRWRNSQSNQIKQENIWSTIPIFKFFYQMNNISIKKHRHTQKKYFWKFESYYYACRDISRIKIQDLDFLFQYRQKTSIHIGLQLWLFLFHIYMQENKCQLAIP